MKTSHFTQMLISVSIAFAMKLTTQPSCGTEVSKAAEQKSSSGAAGKKLLTLGVVIFPSFELLDAYGPLEMWGNLKRHVNIVTIAREKGQVTSSQGPKTMAEFDFNDCPPIDLLLIPGGYGALKVLEDKVTLDWLRSRAVTTQITMSVCNGASVLAAAGLLDGRPATTNKAFWARATTPWPQVKWVKRARWVDDGNIVTSSGVSAGIDMTLHVVARLFGKEAAERLANETEYEWHRDPSWDPYAELHGLVQPPK